MDVSGTEARRAGWRQAGVAAALITPLLLGLYDYWFAVADRYRLFLYEHDMGPLVADTAPFSPVTSSRYWMSGLVAGGLVLVLYGLANWLLGRRGAGYVAPDPRQAWLLCAPWLLLGLPAIMMSQNAPVLPPRLATAVTLVTLAALALALWPGEMAAERPWFLVALLADGLGLALLLIMLAQADDLWRWAIVGRRAPLILSLLGLGAGLGLLLLLSLRFLRPGVRVPRAGQLFLGGCLVAYLLLPLAHHLLGSDGYFYITNSDNFLAGSAGLQLLVWAAAAGLAVLLTRGRVAWQQKSRAARAARLEKPT